ncbi:MAG TPA: four helix bundle protein [Bacteroidales bacterium]|nr:four helix bundle protein [Bacteroidales bacterium]
MGNFKDLKVWQNAKDISVSVYKITDNEKYKTDFGLRDQMRRSSVSVPSNIAEGDDLSSDRQSIKYFYIAKGSVAELRTQLLISFEIGYISEDVYSSIEKQCEEVTAMLTGLIRFRSK